MCLICSTRAEPSCFWARKWIFISKSLAEEFYRHIVWMPFETNCFSVLTCSFYNLALFRNPFEGRRRLFSQLLELQQAVFFPHAGSMSPSPATHTPSKSCSLDWLDMRPSVRINHISTSGPQMVSVRRYSMCYTVTVGRFRAILRPNQTETLALCSPTCFRIDWVTVQQLLAVIRVELHSLIATKTL